MTGGGLRNLKPMQISEFHVETSAPHSHIYKEGKFKVMKIFVLRNLVFHSKFLQMTVIQ